MNEDRNWCLEAEAWLLAERDAAAVTPLLELPLPALPGARLVFKDEAAHATGSLKHRLARSLLLHGIRRGNITRGTPLFDASSGNTAVSEAWFATRLQLPFFAVIPETTSPGKQTLIRQFGGECVLVPKGECCKREAARLAVLRGGYFLDQFTNAARAVDWREHNVIAELWSQLQASGLPEPDWFVTGAGTGGTATCAGRFIQKLGKATRLAVVDPEDSAFFDFVACGRHPSGCLCASRVEGIGRPQVEPSFSAHAVKRMMTIPDAASYAGARWLAAKLGRAVGVSTGTNLLGAIRLLDERRHLARSVIAALVCDDGARYAGQLDNDAWLAKQGLDVAPWEAALECWHVTGSWSPPADYRMFSSAS